MKNLGKLKNFKNYDKTFENNTLDEYTEEKINRRIKEIIENILKVKQYFMLLQDTTEHVYGIIKKQIPPNNTAFVESIRKKDDLLADLIEELVETLEVSTVLSEIEDINLILKNMESYTENNIDEILTGRLKMSNNEEEDDDDFEEEDEDEEDEDDDKSSPRNPFDFQERAPNSNMIIEREPEDQLKRKIKPRVQESKVNENLKKKASEIEDFIKKHSKNIPDKKIELGKFKKGDIVYINGITTPGGKFFNGKKFQIVSKSEDRDDCYDLYQFTKVGKEGEANVFGVPSKFIFKDKPRIITETEIEKKPRAIKEPQIKERPRATKKPDKK